MPPVALVLTIAIALASTGCGRGAHGAGPRQTTQTLVFAAYSTPREAYGEIIAAFKAKWQREHHETVNFRESYQASGALARAVIGGFDADVVALSLEQDIEKIHAAGLITHDFRTVGTHGGMVTNSVVVLAVRHGNPKNIRDWADLRRAEVEVLTPNVRTSGGAMWNVAAIWGAALRGKTPLTGNDPAQAETLLRDVLERVRIMDRSGRDSMLSFERGVGDVAITYENEVILGRNQGRDYEYVIPQSSIRIENPVAIVDRNVDRHHSRALAEAFVTFLASPDAQRIYARHGLRSVDPAVAHETTALFPAVTDLFSVSDIGGWSGLESQVFADGAAYDRAVAATRGNR